MATGKISRRRDRAETLVEAALRVLNTADPFEKAQLGDSVASQWLQGAITQPYDPSLALPIPDRPARLSNADGDDGRLDTGLDPWPDTRLFWAIDWALEGEDGSKVGVPTECCHFFTATSMLLRAADECENGAHEQKFRKKVYGV
ncbi:uncharacterized protein LOC133880374 isoform X3 [Alnus glutinosa]|uniref:uncharacterized protein LOC133880374 isoform X3 n=1 Tax=Alnus glutinosa TaxID=3517 RepID=UPI002D775159|nr:uncharacterized protein LOC133880374 isoform X3 [Alnus glutinosa]